MSNNLVFEETQRFGLLPVIIIFAIAAITIYCIRNFTANKNAKTLLAKGLMFSFAAGTIPLTIAFIFVKLETRIDNEGINIRYTPFHAEWKNYSWNAIKSCEIKRYDPLNDYGGWGIRRRAYNVSGNEGLLLRFTDGNHLLIGTQKPEKLKQALQLLHK